MIHLDQPALIEARRTRLDAACELLSVDGWLLTTSQAVRTATGAWSDDVDLFGEWFAPIVAVGTTVVSPAPPPNDARLIDEVADLLPESGTIAVDRLGPAAMDRLAQVRPELTVQDAALVLGAAKVPRAPVEIDVLVQAHQRTEAVLASMVDLVAPGVSERDLNREFSVACRGGRPRPLAPGHGLQCSSPSARGCALGPRGLGKQVSVSGVDHRQGAAARGSRRFRCRRGLLRLHR